MIELSCHLNGCPGRYRFSVFQIRMIFLNIIKCSGNSYEILMYRKQNFTGNLRYILNYSFNDNETSTLVIIFIT